MAGIAGLSEGLFVASLAEDLFLLKHKGSVVQLLVASAAGEVLRVPYPSHGTRKWATVCEGGRERGEKDRRHMQVGEDVKCEGEGR